MNIMGFPLAFNTLWRKKPRSQNPQNFGNFYLIWVCFVQGHSLVLLFHKAYFSWGCVR